MKSAVRKALIVICAVLLVLSIVSMGKNIFYKASDKKINILVVFKSVENPMEFWETVREGINTAAKEFDVNVNITGPKTESDIDEQIKILNDAAINKPDAIILAASDYSLVVPAVKKINEAGIPLITIDSGINSTLPASFIATDNRVAGKKSGETMAGLAEANKKIIIINHVKGSATAIERENGAIEGLKEKAAGCKYETYYCDASEDKAYQITKDLLSKEDDIGGFIGLNESSTTGIAKAVKEMQLQDKVKIIGFDSSLSEVLFIENGTIQASVVQKPFNIGYLGVKTAVQILKGEKVSKKIDTGSEVITKENMYTKENQKLLFHFSQ